MISDMFEAGLVLGGLLVATAAVIALADSDRLSRSMPTQVMPARLARYPAALGTLLIVLSAVGLAF